MTVKVNWNDDSVRRSVSSQSEIGLFKAGSELLRLSNEIAPKDTGASIQNSFVDANDEEAHVYYTQKYDVRNHETEPPRNFQRDRQNKFLEKPLLSDGERIMSWLAEELKKAFK
jgi:hypothetical protein